MPWHDTRELEATIGIGRKVDLAKYPWFTLCGGRVCVIGLKAQLEFGGRLGADLDDAGNADPRLKMERIVFGEVSSVHHCEAGVAQRHQHPVLLLRREREKASG